MCARQISAVCLTVALCTYATTSRAEPVTTLYRITSGNYWACCGFAGDITFAASLPYADQSFLEVVTDPPTDYVQFRILGDAMQPWGEWWSFYDLVFLGSVYENVATFDRFRDEWGIQEDQTDYTLVIDGAIAYLSGSFQVYECCDVPYDFHHVGVTAMLMSEPLTPCAAQADCDDGQFCNGVERCCVELGGCVPNAVPCLSAWQVCDETVDECQEVSRPGDTDGDGDVDALDVRLLFECFGSPAPPGTRCDIAEITGDRAVGRNDLAVFVAFMTGPR